MAVCERLFLHNILEADNTNSVCVTSPCFNITACATHIYVPYLCVYVYVVNIHVHSDLESKWPYVYVAYILSRQCKFGA